MDGKRKEFVHFSLGFGIFQNDDDLTNGWNVSAAQAPYQGQNVEVEVGGEGEVEVGVEVEVLPEVEGGRPPCSLVPLPVRPGGGHLLSLPHLVDGWGGGG